MELANNAQPGRIRLQNVIGSLEGFESPVGAWEHDLLPARDGIQPRTDSTSSSRAVKWCGAGCSRRGRRTKAAAACSRELRRFRSCGVPILRGCCRRSETFRPAAARWDAQTTYDALTAHGALFFDDLLAATRLLPSQLEDALRELAALGLVTSDGFAAVRATIVKHGATEWRTASRVRKRRHRRAAYAHSGRWSKFPPFVQPPTNEERAERWAWLLLNRYGVMFRDLLARESLAPSWRELASVYRRLEMRGEIRGGRFVAGVAGEQFALADAVERLRQMREEPAEENLHVISAADPLNLVGIVTRDARVPATRSNRVLFANGRPVAASESRTIRWLVECDDSTRQRATQLLLGPDTLRRQEIVAEMQPSFSWPGRVAVVEAPSSPQRTRGLGAR